MNKAGWIPRYLLGRAPLYLLMKATLSLIVLVNAANIIVTPTPYQAIVGGAVSISSNLTGADRGFSKSSSDVAATGTTCPTAAIFGVNTMATPGITAGDMVYDLQVNATGSTPSNTCWSVAFVYAPTGGSQTTLGPIAIGTLNAVSGQGIDCKFDIGASIPNSPFSYSVTVS